MPGSRQMNWGTFVEVQEKDDGNWQSGNGKERGRNLRVWGCFFIGPVACRLLVS